MRASGILYLDATNIFSIYGSVLTFLLDREQISEIEKGNRKRKRLTCPYLAAQPAWHCWPSPPGERLSSISCPLAASARNRPRHLLLRRVALPVKPIPRLETPRSPSLLSLTRCTLSLPRSSPAAPTHPTPTIRSAAAAAPQRAQPWPEIT